MGAVQALREQNYSGGITVLTREPNLPIDRTKLSKALLADKGKLQWRDDAWYKSADIKFVEDEATSVDFSKKSVSTIGHFVPLH